MAVDTVAEVKSRLTIEEVVKPYVQLRKAGRSMVGLCPFHKEKTGSFHVSPERGTYHCFGCGEGGDIFSFIEKVEGVDFKTALQMLADTAGVQIEYMPGGKERADKRERLYEAMARAAQWYAAQLPQSAAEAYARERGLTEKTVEEWGLGHAPDAWRALLEHLGARGFSTPELIAAGLVKEADGKPGTYYDRFRNRLVFPIRDTAGRVVAFTGRTLSSDEQAKYLNSPETDLYRKSEILFGLDRAKEAIRTRGFILLVEGQMDLLHAHQAGWANAVALSGTALTDRHIRLMKRYSDNLMLVLDADNAGLAASANAARLALTEGMRVKAARLPAGLDPADLLAKDNQDFAARVRGAEPVVEFFLSALAEREKDPARLLRHVEAVVLPLIAAMASPMERERSCEAVGRALGLSTESVRESLGRVASKRPRAAATTADDTDARPARSAREARAAMLLGVIQAYPDTPLASRVEGEYARIVGDSALRAEPESVPLAESAIFEAERTFGAEPGEHAADELLGAFEAAVVREAYQTAVRDLRQAEAAGDADLIAAAGARCAELSSRLARLG